MDVTPRKRVALLVETSLGSGREILRGIARYARQSGGWELFHAAGGLAEVNPDWLCDWEGDAVIARIQSSELVVPLERLGIPVVDVLGVCENRFPLVHVDDVAISRMVARYFLDRDFRHLAFYGIDGENWSHRREAAFRNCCSGAESYSLLESPRRSRTSAADRFTRLRTWLRELPKPVAVMVCSDQRGLELLEACLSEGISVPEEVSVVGVDNDLSLCELGAPPLSSVRGGHFQVGYEAARLIDHLLSGAPADFAPLLVPPSEIIERDSSRTFAIDDPVVAKGVRFIRENLAAPITNDSIARASGISRTLFQKRFRNAMNQSIREYILARRIDRALVLVESTDMPLAEIAERSGFRHQEYLGQVVKKATGSTPGQLRKAALQGS